MTEWTKAIGGRMKKSNKATILGLLRGIADQALDQGLPPSRKRAKFEQLQKAVDKEFKWVVPLTQEQEKQATENIEEFGRRTGWEGQSKHHGTMLSFLLAVLDEYDGVFSDRITKIMAELVEHLENRKQFQSACYWSGGDAADILREILEKARKKGIEI